MKKVKILVFIIISCIYGATISASILTGYEHYRLLKPIEILGEDGTLILSNSPETVKESGILYCETLLGPGRLVFHHVNATGDKMQHLVILVKNITKCEQRFEVHKEGTVAPHYHYLEAGNRLLNAYYQCTTSKFFFLGAGEQMILYDSSPLEWKNQMVLSGMLDVYASGEVEIIFAMLDKQDDIDRIETLKKLEMDLAPRGTFQCLTKYQYVVLPKEENAYMLIEDEHSDWLMGIDHLTGRTATNYGNYGVLYKITLMASEDTTVFICPRGGIFQGTIRWDNGETKVIAREHVFKTIKERINIGTIRKNETRTLEYMLPNGSAAPILLGFDINE